MTTDTGTVTPQAAADRRIADMLATMDSAFGAAEIVRADVAELTIALRAVERERCARIAESQIVGADGDERIERIIAAILDGAEAD